MAEAKVLIQGYTSADNPNLGEEKTRPTMVLVRDKKLNIITDPGVISDQKIIVEALKKEGLKVEDIDMVFITHSHLDHYRNVGMFKDAKVLEYFGIWEKEEVEDFEGDLTKNIKIIKTPGHDLTSLTMLVKTARGLVAICGDVFWKENGPKNDSYASDLDKLKKSRAKVLKLADYIIPGHGAEFEVNK